jgi:hypothetical protein
VGLSICFVWLVGFVFWLVVVSSFFVVGGFGFIFGKALNVGFSVRVP